jgi:DNA-binding winged helix-turn-helix (wHTH) protein/tetratricopeptide (TPR) repeat protein
VTEYKKNSFRFGPFRLDVGDRLLSREGEAITLPPKAFETLLILVQNSGRLVTKEDLIRQLWPDTFVEEANLANNISLLRKTLEDDRQGSTYIETVPKSGYRFVAKVTAPINSIAVVPFKPLGETSRDEFLAMGLADTLITRLSQLRQIDVRPLGAVLRYADVQMDPVAIGQEQLVESVLDGNIQKADTKIRVSVRLVRIDSGTTLWASQFIENYTDIFTLQDAISSRVAESLRSTLSGDERQALHKRYTNNFEAYQLYIRGRYFWSKFTEEGLRKSIDYYHQALEKDPNYALAYVGLSASYVVLGVNYSAPAEVMPKAKAYVSQAFDRDIALADAYIPDAAIKYFFDWDWAGAESGFKQAIELGPSDAASAHELYAYYLWTMGRFDQGLGQMKLAQQLDPLSLPISEDVGVAYYYSRNFDQAVEQQNKTIELDGNYFFGQLRRGQAYLQKGMLSEAFEDLTRAKALSGNWPAAVAELGCAYAMAGQMSEAQRVIKELNERAQQQYIDPYLIALVYTSMGEPDAAFEWLTKALKARSPWMVWLRVEPKFDCLRTDSRFAALLRQIGLPLMI